MWASSKPTLLAIYEYIQINHQRGWISAGAVLKVYETDAPESLNSLAD